jgi:methionine-rich copper-binding protein CopC
MRALIAILTLTTLALGSPCGQAHAFLDRASPLVGSTVPTAPHQLTLRFTQNLEPAFSTVQVTGPNGARVDEGRPRISGNVMHVSIKTAGPGTYHVHWRALSVDTHTTQGSFTFHVG